MAKEITISMADSQFESLQEAYAKNDDSVEKADVDGALAASVFHKAIIEIAALKAKLIADGISIRP